MKMIGNFKRNYAKMLYKSKLLIYNNGVNKIKNLLYWSEHQTIGTT